MSHKYRFGLLLLLLPLFSGCYTVIHHQPVTEPVGYYSECSNCHHEGIDQYCVEEAYLYESESRDNGYFVSRGLTNYSYFNDSAWWWYYTAPEDEEEGEPDDSPVARILRRQHSSLGTAIMSAASQVTAVASEGDSSADDDEDEDDQSPRKKLKRRRR